MLTAVKNQAKISWLSIKYAIMRELLNKVTFFTNIIFMILNNAGFIIQWVVLYSLRDNIGGYSFREVLLLWGIAAGSYGVSRFFFKKAFSLSEIINEGKLDSFLVQPKNVLLSVITTDVEPSALGDLIYGYIVLFIFGFTIERFFLFTLFSITSGIFVTAIAIILGSLSFWFSNTESIADVGNSLMTNFATYPDGIFKGLAKMLLFTLVPVGLANYIPVQVIIEFNLLSFIIVLATTIFMVCLAFVIFYKGLKRYSSSNLMVAKI